MFRTSGKTIVALAILAMAAWSAPRVSAQSRVMPDLTGTWVLNTDLSDRPGQGGQSAGHDGGGRRGPGGGGMGRPGGGWAGKVGATAAAVAVAAGEACRTPKKWNGCGLRWMPSCTRRRG